jgi:RimJ/RimL family protein N-acetyltransferase
MKKVRTTTTMSRTRDFDPPEFIQQPVFLEFQDVVVRSIPWSQSAPYSALREKNQDSIAPFQIIDETSNAKIPLVIDYQGSPAGEICIWNIHESGKACMISYWVDQPLRRKKIATYAVALVTDYCMYGLDMSEVEAPVLPENEASSNLLRNLSYGMVGYQTFTGSDQIQRAHDMYLLVKPENAIDFSLVEFIEMMEQDLEE